MKLWILRSIFLLALIPLLNACAVATGPHARATSGQGLHDSRMSNPEFGSLGGLSQSNRITGVGYAVVSVQPHDNAEQRRLMAMRSSRLEAYRALAEQVYGQYVEADTTIADLTLIDDRFRSRVQGVIFGARVVSIEPVGEDSYQTTLHLDMNAVDSLREWYLRYFVAGSTRS